MEETQTKIVLAGQALEAMGFKDLFKVAINRAILDSGHFSTMPPERLQKFATIAQEELDLAWPTIEQALASDLSKSYNLAQMSDMAEFAKTPIVGKIMRAVVFGEPMPTKASITDQDVLDLQQMKEKPYLRDLLGFGINPYRVQDRIETLMYRALERLNKETVP